jgi:DNA (cytosine-5)-methyltransferase 1
MRSLELFTGAGGLALGIDRGGFEHIALVEKDEDSCRTIAENARRNVENMQHWNVHPVDVRKFKVDLVPEGIELLGAGVPCQPFSIGGKHKGHSDERNLFPETLEIIRKVKPRAVLIENVRGLKRPSFAKYFGYIELMLTYPELKRRDSESWLDHVGRLERYHTKGRPDGLHYRVVSRVLNAANYGIPQRRERLFFVAVRGDMRTEWSFPNATHAAESLIWQQLYTDEYWDRHGVAKKERVRRRAELGLRVSALKEPLWAPPLKPWVTVRDAISSLSPSVNSRTPDEPGLTHFAIAGARAYAGHTGSPLDEPAKTLKAGVHGVPGGENMLAMPDGSVRYFTIRESARLQTFPDAFVFPGSWTESMRQIGNAVPVALAEILAKELHRTLTKN